MPFIDLTINAGTSVAVNTDQILFVEPNGSRAKINWVNGGHLHVDQSYGQVDEQLPKYAILTAEVAEAIDSLTEAAQDLKQKQEEAADASNTEGHAAAEEAKTADSGNPAKKRETK